MKKIKKGYKSLMFVEATFVYCIRHDLDYDKTLDNLFKDGGELEFEDEYELLCKDLRFYRCIDSYESKTITDEEYDMCVDEFGVGDVL